MAQSVPPGDIATQPNAKIVINSSAIRIGYGIKTTNMKRLGFDPPCGVLDPNEAVLLAVSCVAFAYGQEDTNNDRITIEWTNTADGAAKQFRREWFQRDVMVRRKNLPIEYNQHSTHGINTVFRATRLTMTSEVPHDSALVEAATAKELLC
uniref:Major sperm protein n=3 Tax=Caenorhabditis japonica TaxID=281687 RepID=A0A8R1EFJ5_CAEJA